MSAPAAAPPAGPRGQRFSPPALLQPEAG